MSSKQKYNHKLKFNEAVGCINKANEEEYKGNKVEAQNFFQQAFDSFITITNHPENTIDKKILKSYLGLCGLGIRRLEKTEESEEEKKIRENAKSMEKIPKNKQLLGVENILDIMRETIIEPWKRNENLPEFRNILLFGPAGCGKSNLPEKLAAEAAELGDVGYFKVKMGKVLSKWVGESEKNVEALFDEAAEHRIGSIIHIDEIDALLGTDKKSREDSPILKIQGAFQQLLDPDGEEQYRNIVVIGTTNKPHVFSDAMERRFPIRLFIKPPNRRESNELAEFFAPEEYREVVKKLKKNPMLRYAFYGRTTAQIKKYIERASLKTREYSKWGYKRNLEKTIFSEVPYFMRKKVTPMKEWIELAREHGAPIPSEKDLEWDQNLVNEISL